MITISGYKVLDSKPWRSGGMADVYRARHLRHKQECVVKVLKAKFKNDAIIKQNFFREHLYAKTLGKTNDRLAGAFDKGQLGDGRPYMVMKLLHGEDCSSLLERAEKANKQISIKLAAHIIREAAVVLSGLHNFLGHSIIHRDISPDNIIVGKDMKSVYLIDFGIAAGLEGDIVPAGKPLYTPPEGHDRPAPASDIYALGVVMYLLLSSQGSWKHSTLRSTTTHGSMMQAVMDLKRLRPDVPEWMLALLKQMLAKDPQQRPTADAVEHQLMLALDLEPKPNEIDVVLDKGETKATMSGAMQALVIGSSLLSIFLLIGSVAFCVWFFMLRKPVDTGYAEVKPNADWPQEIICSNVVQPVRYFSTMEDVRVGFIQGNKIVPLKAGVQKNSKQLFRMPGHWGREERIIMRAPGAGKDERKVLRYPDMPLIIDLLVMTSNQVARPHIQILSPFGVKLWAGTNALQTSVLTTNKYRQSAMYTPLWGEKVLLHCSDNETASNGVVIQIDMPHLEDLRKKPQPGNWFEFLAVPGVDYLVHTAEFQRVSNRVRQFNASDDPVLAQNWQDASMRDEIWLQVDKQTQTRLIVDQQPDIAPHWPRLKVSRPKEERGESLYVSVKGRDVRLDEDIVLKNVKWGRTIDYFVETTISNRVLKERFTLVLEPDSIKELCGLDTQAGLDVWVQQEQKWKPYLMFALQEELQRHIKDKAQHSDITSELTLVTKGQGPRHPTIRWDHKGPGEELEIKGALKAPVAGVNLTLQSVRWGETITYRVRGLGGTAERVLAIIPGQDIKTFCGIAGGADSNTVKRLSEKWKPYLTADLYQQLTGVAQNNAAEEYLNNLTFSKTTELKGQDYLNEIEIKYGDFHKLCEDSDLYMLTNFWWRVFENAKKRGEGYVQRGALFELQKNGVKTEWTPLQLDLPLADKGGTIVVGTVDKNMTFSLQPVQQKNDNWSKLVRDKGTGVVAASMLPHVLKLEISYNDKGLGIHPKWQVLLKLIPDGTCMFQTDRNVHSWTNRTAFYMLETEMPLEAIRMAFQRWNELMSNNDPSGRELILRGRGRSVYVRADERLAKDFCDWLSDRLGLTPFYANDAKEQFDAFWVDGVRLPHTQEWQYAATLGMPATFWKVADVEELTPLVYFNQPPGKMCRLGCKSSAQYPVGVCDLCGNAWELVHADGDLAVVAQGGDLFMSSTRGVMPWTSTTYTDARGVEDDQHPISFRFVLPVYIHRFNMN